MTIGPLDGVRVVEISSWMAAPSAGAVLADMGADVVKVEPLTGDVVRNMSRKAKGAPDIDHSFHMDNRGKRSIAVALDRPDGAEVVRKLIDRADVFLCNLLPHRQERYGLDPATVHARTRRVVHATLSGYGLVGPDVTRPGFDVTTFFGRGRDHRRDDRARRRRPDAASGAGRPHDRHRHGRRHPGRPARRREDGGGAGRRRQPLRHRGLDDGQRPRADARRRGAGRASATATT